MEWILLIAGYILHRVLVRKELQKDRRSRQRRNRPSFRYYYRRVHGRYKRYKRRT
jgi:hypothetical protein